MRGWSAADVLQHLVDTQRTFLLTNGASLPDPAPVVAQGPALAWRTHSEAVARALADPRVGEAPYETPSASRPSARSSATSTASTWSSTGGTSPAPPGRHLDPGRRAGRARRRGRRLGRAPIRRRHLLGPARGWRRRAAPGAGPRTLRPGRPVGRPGRGGVAGQGRSGGDGRREVAEAVLELALADEREAHLLQQLLVGDLAPVVGEADERAVGALRVKLPEPLPALGVGAGGAVCQPTIVFSA